MAGHNKPTLAMDPALIKYASMHDNRHKYFRWTPRTAWITIVYVVIVPSVIGTIAYRTDGKYDLRGKLRGDAITKF